MCIQKTSHGEPYDRIASVGIAMPDGTTLFLSQAQAISAILLGTDSFFVVLSRETVPVTTATRNGRQYLKSVRDRLQPADLLMLPDCCPMSSFPDRQPIVRDDQNAAVAMPAFSRRVRHRVSSHRRSEGAKRERVTDTRSARSGSRLPGTSHAAERGDYVLLTWR